MHLVLMDFLCSLRPLGNLDTTLLFSMNSATAGLSNIEEVNEVIAEKLNNGEVSAHLLLSKSEYVKDFEGNNVTLAFLRQYPYGIGGLEELRMVPNNNSIKKTTTDDYFQHVTNLSNLMFQTPLFTLVAFNMYYRTKIVQSLGWKMYAKKNISKSIATLDVSTAISALQQNIKQKKRNKRKYYNNLNMISQESDDEELNSGENTNNK